MGTHIKFVEGDPKPKTKTWNIWSNKGAFLGIIKWFGQWRKYAFFPAPETIFEEVCLSEIADFCVEKTKEHRKRNK